MPTKFFLLCIFLFFFIDLPATNAENHNDAIIQLREINREKPVPGILINPRGVSTSENGTIVSVALRLKTRPIAEIVLGCTSSNLQEGIVEDKELIFNPENWNQTQLIRVKGVDDHRIDGDQHYFLMINVSSHGDLEYDRLPDQPVTMVNKDNDKAGFIIQTVKSTTTETGESAGYMIRLTSKPSSDVIIPVSSTNIREGIPEVEIIRLTPENWDIKQSVSIEGKDDNISDGPVVYEITHGEAMSDDLEYHGKKVPAVTLTNLDNDTAGIESVVQSRLINENNGNSYIYINLSSQPMDEVIVTATSSDLSEADVNPSHLVFDTENWINRQKIRVIAREDMIDDDDQEFTITLSAHKSRDMGYASIPGQVIRMINKDKDRAGLVIVKYETNTSENGKHGKIGIKLNSQPCAKVQLYFESENQKEGRLLLNELTFTDKDWFQEKIITAVGVDDKKSDGNRPYTITISSPDTLDLKYSKLQPVHILMVNLDNEEAGFTVTKNGDLTREDGETVLLSFVLNAQPDASVKIGLISSNLKEATIQPFFLVFEPSNWNTPQIAIVTGQADDSVDGDKPFTIEISIESTDKKFTTKPTKINLTNIDTNSYRLLVNILENKTSEVGGKARFMVNLNARPDRQLQIDFRSSDSTEGIPVPSHILFNRNNWSIPQIVEITGMDDDVKDGDVSYQIEASVKSSEESIFADLEPVNIGVINIDNDEEGVSVRPINSSTSEDGEIGKFAIRLNSAPTSSVVFIFACSDPTECEMVDYHAAFFPENWDKEQIISVKGLKDQTVDGDQGFYVSSLGAISRDSNYSRFPFKRMKFTNRDKDRAGFSIAELKSQSSEDGDVASFVLRLTSIPESMVKLEMASSDESEGDIFTPHMVFTRENWNDGYLVEVIGKEDEIMDGDRDFNVIFAPAESKDSQYNGLHPETIQITNRDSMRLTLGLTLTWLMLQEELKTSIDDSTATGLTAGYVISRDLDLDLHYLQALGTGSRTVNKYSLSNPMEYTLVYSALSLGGKYTFMKSVFNIYAKTGLDVSFWELQSNNKLTRVKKSDSGTSMGTYVGIGCDITLFGFIFMAVDGSYHYLTRGLGNTQFTLSLKYPI